MDEDKKINDRLQWFYDRVGKVVYRNNYCECPVCVDVYLTGILLKDKDHAAYCYDHELLYTADGSPMKYFDTREQMLEFEKQIEIQKQCLH